MTYFYYWHYTPNNDAFWAFIDDGTTSGPIIFEIISTESVCEFIKCGIMKHIDDVDGLEVYLKEKTILDKHDRLIFKENGQW